MFKDIKGLRDGGGSFLLKSILVLVGIGLWSTACTEQHNPVPDWERFNKEQEIANKPTPVLKDDGTLPNAGEGKKVAVAGIDKKYQDFCASCHGANGDGKGPGGAGLNPPPRAFTDMAWQSSVDDAHIAKVIGEGGSSVGLSATMAAWGAVLPGDDLNKMVQKVRSFGK